ncbi:putative F-box/LRR-repeat/kelch-repeat protein At1g11620 [Bidens hawaiensis]|uniref:putative F-box/LRR-repeat/kelch-repeat protein At1g11620 n=1 Tax=Bidens hawaiensis TaxID=980011 RepID=UPI004049F7BC
MYLLVSILEFHILAKLTAKDIGRCRTVCKEWYSFLSTLKFAKLHLGATSTSAKKVVLATPEHFAAVATFIYDGRIFYRDKVIDIPFNVHPFEFITIGSLDGMLCVCLKKNSRMSIRNPLTGSKRDLPTSNDNGFFEATCDAFAFYLDSFSEYKCFHVKRGVRESGGIYFTVGEFWSAFVKLILCFDVNLETFTNVGLPSFHMKLVGMYFYHGVHFGCHIGISYVSKTNSERHRSMWDRVQRMVFLSLNASV